MVFQGLGLVLHFDDSAQAQKYVGDSRQIKYIIDMVHLIGIQMLSEKGLHQ